MRLPIGRPKFKVITKKGRPFLYRLSMPTKSGSIKFHLIVNDDIGEPHIHPWIFTSFLALGAYKEVIDGREVPHLPFSVLHYDQRKRHKVVLYRIFGVRLPCLTIGKYTLKVQPWCEQKELCDLCKPHGHCLDKEYWADKPDGFPVSDGLKS